MFDVDHKLYLQYIDIQNVRYILGCLCCHLNRYFHSMAAFFCTNTFFVCLWCFAYDFFSYGSSECLHGLLEGSWGILTFRLPVNYTCK